MSVSCFRIGAPFGFLLVGTPSPSGIAPLVQWETLASFKRHVGGQSGLFRLQATGKIQSAYELRYDRTAKRVTAFDRDCLGRVQLVVSLALPVGLLLSNGGTDDLGRDMRALFSMREDADAAAADVVRALEALQAVMH